MNSFEFQNTLDPKRNLKAKQNFDAYIFQFLTLLNRNPLERPNKANRLPNMSPADSGVGFRAAITWPIAALPDM